MDDNDAFRRKTATETDIEILLGRVGEDAPSSAAADIGGPLGAVQEEAAGADHDGLGEAEVPPRTESYRDALGANGLEESSHTDDEKDTNGKGNDVLDEGHVEKEPLSNVKFWEGQRQYNRVHKHGKLIHPV